MPNIRSKDQTLIAFPLDQRLLAALDKARGEKSRSQFIREALFGELARVGNPVDMRLIKAPDRVGKGGPKGKKIKVRGMANIVSSPGATQNFSSTSGLSGRGRMDDIAASQGLNEREEAEPAPKHRTPVSYPKPGKRKK